MVSLKRVVSSFQLTGAFGQFSAISKAREYDPSIKNFLDERRKAMKGRDILAWHIHSEMIEAASMPKEYIGTVMWENYNLSYKRVFLRAGLGAMIGTYAIFPIIGEYVFGGGISDGVPQMLTPTIFGAILGCGWGTIQRGILDFEYTEERLLRQPEENHHN